MPMVVMEVALRNAWPATGQICSHSEKNHRSGNGQKPEFLTAVLRFAKDQRRGDTFLRTNMAAKRSRGTFTRTI
jgi:hypothetical protein